MLALDNCYISTYLDKKSWSTSFCLETFAGTAGLCAQSKFLFKCLSTIKNWHNIIHININGEIRGRQHMPCVIKRCADTGRFFLYFLPCRLLFVVLPFEELDVIFRSISSSAHMPVLIEKMKTHQRLVNFPLLFLHCCQHANLTYPFCWQELSFSV